jgi:hypothetical protein
MAMTSACKLWKVQTATMMATILAAILFLVWHLVSEVSPMVPYPWKAQPRTKSQDAITCEQLKLWPLEGPNGHISHHIGRHLVFLLSLGLVDISIVFLTPENPKIEPKIKTIPCIQDTLWPLEGPNGHISHSVHPIGRHLVFCLSLGLGGNSNGFLTPENPNLETKITTLTCIQPHLWSYEDLAVILATIFTASLFFKSQDVCPISGFD